MNQRDIQRPSPIAEAAAFAWGFAEATFFFLVPDVLLTFVACRAPRAAFRSTLYALLGALLGGALLYGLARQRPENALALLNHVPGISPSLVASAQRQTDELGLKALLYGPLRGVPYKIYAVDWGLRRGNFPAFMLASIPARYLRFLLSALLAGAIARCIAPWTRRNWVVELIIHGGFWGLFYSFYFARFGW